MSFVIFVEKKNKYVGESDDALYNWKESGARFRTRELADSVATRVSKRYGSPCHVEYLEDGFDGEF